MNGMFPWRGPQDSVYHRQDSQAFSLYPFKTFLYDVNLIHSSVRMQKLRRSFVPYLPEPIDTSGIRLSSDLNGVVELLAKNTHENWARERMSQGWKYGTERNETKKEHPCLVPYAALPEAEKEYDRMIVREVLKTLLSCGFAVHKR
jgi:hypothetical protein